MKALTCTHDGVTVILKGEESRIDSRIVARLLGIKHDNFMQTLERYQSELRTYGVFLFQTGKPPRGTKGGRPEKYAMLNEDQFVFSITLSRNTPRVVQAKKAVVLAFGQARRLLAAQGHYLPAYHALHTAAQQLQAVAQARGSSAPAHAPHINLERLNNKLLGRKAGERADYTPAEKAVLATLCQLEQRAIERTINDGGDDRQAFQAAKSAASAYMQQFGQDLMEAA